MAARNRGVGILEVLIAAAILAIVIGLLANFITGSVSVSKKIQGKLECESSAAALIADIKSRDNAVDITNSLVNPLASTGRSSLPLWNPPEPPRVFQNIESATTVLYQTYLNDNDLCENNPGGLDLGTNSHILSDPSLISDLSYDVRIHVQPSTGNCSDFSRLSVPRTNGGDTVSNLNVTIRIDYQEPNGSTGTCAAGSTVGYRFDGAAPTLTIPRIRGSNGGPLNPPAQASPPCAAYGVGCTNTLCDATEAWVELQSSEPGSVFLCSSNPADPIENWVNCDDFDLGAGTDGALSLLSTNPNALTNAWLRFTGLPEGVFRFYVQAVDTAGQASGPSSEVFFTVDQNRPIWSQNPRIRTDGTVVDTVAGLPTGTGFSAADPQTPVRTALFPPNELYQCKSNLIPIFQGEVSSSFLNETCEGVTSDGRVATGTLSNGAPNVCRLEVPSGGPNGPVSLSALVRDVCNPSPDAVAPEASGSINWFVDPFPPDAVEISHQSFVALPDAIGLFSSVGPSFTASHTRGAPAPATHPEIYETPRVGGGSQHRNSSGPQPATVNVTAADIGWGTAPFNSSCEFGRGLCFRAWGPCGQRAGSGLLGAPGALPYAVRGKSGDSCWSIPCDIGLSCNLVTGVCQANNACGSWRCSTDAECTNADYIEGNATGCVGYNGTPNSGQCSGGSANGRACSPGNHGDCVSDAGVGFCNPATRLCECPGAAPVGYYGLPGESQEPQCADLSGLCGMASSRVCSCPPAQASACPAFVVNDSCGIPRCRGKDNSACNTSSPLPDIQATCQDMTGSWLGAGNQTLVVTHNNGGFPSYTVECSDVSENGPWRDCTYNDWKTSPTNYPVDQNENLPYWGKVTDGRGDYSICSGLYKLDDVPPTVGPLGLQAGECGTNTNPTLAPTVGINYQARDTHSVVSISVQNITPGGGPNFNCSNTTMDGNPCRQTDVWVQGQPGVNSPNVIRVRATDQAGNRTDATFDIFAAVRVGLGLAVSAGNPSYTDTGCSGCAAPFNTPISATLSGFNTFNLSSSISYSRCLNGAGCANGTMTAMPGGAQGGLRFNTLGINTLSYTFSDSCSTGTATAQSPLRLDWQSPTVTMSCDEDNLRVRINANDTHSGVQQVRGNCGPVNRTSASSPLYINVGYGNFNCTGNAVDRAGNDSASSDGTGTVRTDTQFCSFPAPPPPTTTTTTTGGGGGGTTTTTTGGGGGGTTTTTTGGGGTTTTTSGPGCAISNCSQCTSPNSGCVSIGGGCYACEADPITTTTTQTPPTTLAPVVCAWVDVTYYGSNNCQSGCVPGNYQGPPNPLPDCYNQSHDGNSYWTGCPDCTQDLECQCN